MLTIILPTHTAPIFEYDKHKLKVKGKLDTTWGDQKVDVLRYLNFFSKSSSVCLHCMAGGFAYWNAAAVATSFCAQYGLLNIITVSCINVVW